MRTVSKIIAFAVTGVLLGTGSIALNALELNSAQAQSQSAKSIVDSAKSAGKIGETAAGYLDAVNGQSLDAATKAAMNEINIARKSLYTRLANEQNVKTEVVATLTGEKQIAKARPGEYVLKSTGTWSQK
jgi:uncharacterized protein YdbL (DUF1318 family)